MSYLRSTAAILLGVASMATLAQAEPQGGTACVGVYEMARVPHWRTRVVRHSNIVPSDTTMTRIAPELPTPPISPDADAGAFLKAAHCAIAARRTGEAQQSLEMAETRVLGGSIPAGANTIAGDTERASTIRIALYALGANDLERADQLIHQALPD